MKSFPKFILVHFIAIAILTWWASDHIFFWDTISQGSRLVDFYYQTNFQQLLLPTEIDQGHPPLFQIYIALGWKIFGRTLFVSHFMMLPILIGIVWQLFKIVEHFFDSKYHWIALTLPFFDTSFLAQSILVSPDILLLFAFLMGLNGILKNRSWLIGIGSVILGLTSIRGIVMVIVLFMIRGFIQRGFPNFKNLVSPFFPAFILTSAYLIFHFFETGWWISTPNESWSSQRGFVGLSGILKNIGIAGWRLFDFGKIGIWIVVGIWILRKFRDFPDFKDLENLKSKEIQLFLVLFTFLFLNIGLFMWFSNPLAHRYFLPAFIIQVLFVAYLLLELTIFGKASKYVLIGILVLMVSGNFWVYPDKIAQGWDSTMAHIPYYELRKEMVNYMVKNEIPLSETGTGFPNKSPFDELDLSGQQEGMNQKDFSKNQYILYSNVMNDFSDKQMLELNQKWEILKNLEKRGIKIILYKK